MLGYLPQNFGYYPEFKVWDFLLYVAALKGLSRAKAEEKSGEMLKVTGLMSEKAHKIKNLSGGMKRRLGCLLYTSSWKPILNPYGIRNTAGIFMGMRVWRSIQRLWLRGNC